MKSRKFKKNNKKIKKKSKRTLKYKKNKLKRRSKTRRQKIRKTKRKHKRKINRKNMKGGVVPQTEEQLEGILNENNINLSKWKKKYNNKTVEDLLTEIKQGESILEKKEGSLYRSVNVAKVIVLSDDEQYKLREAEHLDKNFLVVKERDNVYLSEKMKPDEKFRAAIIRGVSEELGSQYSDDIEFLGDEVIRVEKKSSHSYPGLMAMYMYYEGKIKIPSLTSDYPPPSSFLIREENGGIFKRYIRWEWVPNENQSNEEKKL